MDIIKQHSLSRSGFLPDGSIFEMDADRLHLIRGFIWKNFKPTGTKKVCSYSLKHYVEDALGDKVKHYVSNGELIVAMIAEGYKPLTITGPNCWFKVDTESEYKKGFRFGKKIWKQRPDKYDDMMDRHELFLEECVGEGGYDPVMNLDDLGYRHAMIKWHIDNGMATDQFGDYRREVFFR